MTHQTKFEAPLASVRGLGSAKTGTEHWWHQRLTSLALIPLTLWLLFSLVPLLPDATYGDMVHWFSSPLNAVLLMMFIGVTFHHTMAGLEVVFEDYMHCHCLKAICIFLMKFLGYGLTTACLYAVLKVSFLAGV